MSVKNYQIEVPFTPADAVKLASIAPDAAPQPDIASEAEAEAGLDDSKMMTPRKVREAIQALVPPGSNPITADNKGLGVGVYADKVGMSLEFKSLIAGSGITLSTDSDTITLSAVTGGLFLNNTGVTIPGMSIVWQDTSGNMHPFTSPSVEAQVTNILGLVLTDTDTGTQNTVYYAGLITNITTTFALGNVIYLSKYGAMTPYPPDIGVGGFAPGDFVIKLGVITKNSITLGNLDFNLSINLIGQL